MQRAMRNCLAYCNRKTQDPLVQIAIVIAQLLIIHPFMDGNGRVARILATLLIYKKGLLAQPVLFLSSYFQAHRKTYIRKLYEITEKGKWEEWILFFLKGVKQQAKKP
jgi:Fic family protein